ncbi:Actin-binding LIM protein 1 [Schistosoma japonicum]|nr:Actin-binding LIM protein 1 [Schistosoma japonicum]
MVKVYCTVCNKRCKGDVLKIEQQFVHYKCFQCLKCRKNLKQGGFFVKDKKFYCPNDYQTEFGVRCETCHGYVEGEVVTVLGKTFHTHCFRCTTCRRLFNSGERTTIVDGSYYCMSCSSNLTNGSVMHNIVDSGAGPITNGTGGISSQVMNRSSSSSPLSTSPSSKINPFNAIPLSSSSQSKTMPAIKTSYTTPTRHPVNHTNSISHNHNHSHQQPTFISDSNLKSFASLNDQLSVQIQENGCSIPGSEYHKQKLEEHGFGPVTVDTLLSTTPGQTISPNSFTPSACERRICPPGVDYGRQYPISYLQLSEQGFTAIMSSEELNPGINENVGRRSRSLARSNFSPSHTSGQHQHVSRRDVVRSATSNSVPYRHPNDVDMQKPLNGYCPSKPPSYSGTSISIGAGNTPISLTGRPKRDIYIRQRQLSPGSTSLGSGVMGFRRSERMNSSTLPPGLENIRQSTGRYSCRSTPNVTGKRGMTQLAESLVRPRFDRTASPPSATLYWSEARRLASFPNARLPDSNSLPAIDRYDFPAPPSPAVVMIDKRREKRMTGTIGLDSQNGTLRNGTMTSVDTDWTDRDPALNAKLDRIDAEIETLKRLGESSGITTALIQELEASKQHVHETDLDPISASRSPNANVEPSYKTRYRRHGYTSPSRDTRRDRRSGHNLSYRLEYSSTGGRSGTIPSFPSTPRPGYTSGILYGRAVSLPRPFIGVENGDTLLDQSTLSGHAPVASSGIRGSLSTTLRTIPSHQSYHPGGHSDHSCDAINGPDRTVTVSESLNTNFIENDSRPIGFHDASLTTSGLSMDGLIAESGDDITVTSPYNGYFMKSGTVSGLPSSVTGLRPVGLPPHHPYHHHYKSSSAMRRGRTSTPAPATSSSGMGYLTDPDLLDIDAYPSVQSWLRPTASSSKYDKSFQTYPYEMLKLSSNQLLKGVDRTQLECYLSSDEFESLFKMRLDTFQRLPEWKRNDLKKKLDLL